MPKVGYEDIFEAKSAITDYIWGYSQTVRPHIFNNYLTPLEKEKRYFNKNLLSVVLNYFTTTVCANDYIDLADEYNKIHWGDNYVVSTTSAQTVADLAGSYYSELGGRRVGIPLLVHRRCLEPMFSIANKIAYKNKMVSLTNVGAVAGRPILPSGWLNVEETDPKGFGYANITEADVALNLVEFLVNKHKDMIEGGVFIITPFTQMRKTLQKEWKKRAANSVNAIWMQQAFGESGIGKDIEDFSKENIGTIHTFQGKEASVVILCLAASEVRKKMVGVKWVNSKP